MRGGLARKCQKCHRSEVNSCRKLSEKPWNPTLNLRKCPEVRKTTFPPSRAVRDALLLRLKPTVSAKSVKKGQICDKLSSKSDKMCSKVTLSGKNCLVLRLLVLGSDNVRKCPEMCYFSVNSDHNTSSQKAT